MTEQEFLFYPTILLLVIISFATLIVITRNLNNQPTKDYKDILNEMKELNLNIQKIRNDELINLINISDNYSFIKMETEFISKQLTTIKEIGKFINKNVVLSNTLIEKALIEKQIGLFENSLQLLNKKLSLFENIKFEEIITNSEAELLAQINDFRSDLNVLASVFKQMQKEITKFVNSINAQNNIDKCCLDEDSDF